MNKEVIIISDLSESSGGTFAATAHVEARFPVIAIFCLHRTLYKIHSWTLQSVKKERVPICQEKKENFPCESDWYWRSSMLASRFWTKKSLSNQNLPYIMLKTKSPLLSASTSLDTKTSTLASNRNFESCMSIRCFAPQHILQFFHFCRGFFFRLWELCSSLCRPPLSDRDKKKKKKKNVSAMGFFSREILIHSQWH